MKNWVYLLIVLSLIFVPTLQAKQPCSIHTITGTYAFEITGSRFFGAATATPGVFAGPFLGVTMVGEFTIDATGTATGTYWMASGIMNTLEDTLPWNATFTVNSDCTGQVNYNALADGKLIVEKLAIIDNGAELRTIVHGIASPSLMGAVWETTAWRIARPQQAKPWCAPNSLVGDYTIRCAGWDVAPNGMMLPSMMLTQVNIAHGGDFTGTAFMTVGPSAISDIAVSGTITVAPDCTSEAVMNIGTLGTVIAKGVFYNNGRNGVGMPMYHQEDPINHHSVGNMCQYTRTER